MSDVEPVAVAPHDLRQRSDLVRIGDPQYGETEGGLRAGDRAICPPPAAHLRR